MFAFLLFLFMLALHTSCYLICVAYHLCFVYRLYGKSQWPRSFANCKWFLWFTRFVPFEMLLYSRQHRKTSQLILVDQFRFHVCVIRAKRRNTKQNITMPRLDPL